MIYVYVLNINRKPVLHVAGEATNYQAAHWLSMVSTAVFSQAPGLSWIEVYLISPDFISHDTRKHDMV